MKQKTIVRFPRESSAAPPLQPHSVLFVTPDAAFTRRWAGVMTREAPHMEAVFLEDPAEARSLLLGPSLGAQGTPPAAVVLDVAALNNGSWEVVLREFCRLAPLILLTDGATPGARPAGEAHAQDLILELVASGALEVANKHAVTPPLLLGLLNRHIRLHGQVRPRLRAAVNVPGDSGPVTLARFGEMLRHEVNNPLTGILGNAELLLARRDQLPAYAVARLRTIADLAIRIREAVRIFSDAAAATGRTARSVSPSRRSG